jgi:hypothetical protein
MMGDQSRDVRRLARPGRPFVTNLPLWQGAEENGGVLFVASSDLSHYFDDDTARRLDQRRCTILISTPTGPTSSRPAAGQPCLRRRAVRLSFTPQPRSALPKPL